MATIEQVQVHLRRAVREAVQKVLAEGDLPVTEEGQARFTTIETLALAAGDAVRLEVFEQQLTYVYAAALAGRALKEGWQPALRQLLIRQS